MISKVRLRERFLEEPLSVRLGELAVTFGRVSACARKAMISSTTIALKEARYMIEWTASETKPEIAAELVSMQRLITLWIKAWEETNQTKDQRTLLSVQAKQWSDRALDFSGLISQ